MTGAANPAGHAVVDRVKDAVARESDPMRRAEALIFALAEAIKATSNDQNVQRLARALRASAAELAAGVAAERV